MRELKKKKHKETFMTQKYVLITDLPQKIYHILKKGEEF